MTRLAIASLMTLALLPSLAEASPETGTEATAPKCRSVEWPFARKQHKRDLVKIMTKVPRQALNDYLFYEVTHPHAPAFPGEPMLAYALVTYLSGTEQQEDLRGFYEVVRWGAKLDDPKATRARKLELKDVCEYFRKAYEPDAKPKS